VPARLRAVSNWHTDVSVPHPAGCETGGRVETREGHGGPRRAKQGLTCSRRSTALVFALVASLCIFLAFSRASRIIAASSLTVASSRDALCCSASTSALSPVIRDCACERAAGVKFAGSAGAVFGPDDATCVCLASATFLADCARAHAAADSSTEARNGPRLPLEFASTNAASSSRNPALAAAALTRVGRRATTGEKTGPPACAILTQLSAEIEED
jgi:hypothetical protein